MGNSEPQSAATERTTNANDPLDENNHQTLKELFFGWPVANVKLSRGFLPNKKRPHLGIDITGPKGTPIYAAHDGTIIYTGHEFRGYGKMILIEGENGWASLYAHFNKITVEEGQTVKKGDMIGQMGRTGRATGVHLHFELRKNKGPVNPLLYLPRGTDLKQYEEIDLEGE